MSEQIGLKVDLRLDDDKAVKDLNNFKKKFKDEKIKIDIDVKSGDLGKMSNDIEIFTKNLKGLDKALKGFGKGSDNSISKATKGIYEDIGDLRKYLSKTGSEDLAKNVERISKDYSKAIDEIQEMESYGDILKDSFKEFNKDIEVGFESFISSQKKIDSEVDKLTKGNSNNAFKKIVTYQKELADIEKAFAEFGISKNTKEHAKFETFDGKIAHNRYEQFEEFLSKDANESEKILDLAKKLGQRKSELNRNISNNLDKINDEEKKLLDKINSIYKESSNFVNIKPSEDKTFMLKQLLESALPDVDKLGLDFNRTDDIINGYNRYFESLERMKKEFNNKFKSTDGFEPLKLMDVQKEKNILLDESKLVNEKEKLLTQIRKLDSDDISSNKFVKDINDTIDKIDLGKIDKIGDKLSKAFNIDDKAINNLKQIENSMKEFNKLSKDVQKDLIGGKSLDEIADANKLKEMQSSISKVVKEYEKYEKQITNIKKKQDDLFSKGKSNEALGLDKQIKDLERYQETLKDDFVIKFKGEGYDKVASEIDKIIDKYKEIDNLNRGQSDAKQWDKLSSDIGKASNEINKFADRFKDLDGASEYADKLRNSLNDIGKNMDLDSANRKLEEIRKNLKDVTDAAERASKELKSMDSGFSMLGNFGRDFKDNLFTFTAGELLADGIQDVVRSLGTLVMEWDTAFANLKKVANFEDVMNIDQLDAIGQRAIEIAKNTGNASQDVIQAIADTIQMGGYGMEEATKIADITMQMANVAEMTQEAASKGIVTMMSAFNLDPLKEVPVVVDGATKSVDQLTKSIDMVNHVGNKFAVSSDGILDAISSGANVLAAYGADMEDVIAMITAANTTLQDTSRVGNGLKTIQMNLNGIKTSAETGQISLNKTAKVLQEIAGIDVFEEGSKTEIKDMATLIEELGAKWDTFNDKQKAGLSEGIAGKQQAAVFQSLMQNLDVMKQVQNELSNTENYIGSMAKENEQYVSSLAGKLNKLKETWVGIFQTVYDSDAAKGLVDSLIKVSEVIADIINKLDEMGLLEEAVMLSLGLGLKKMYDGSEKAQLKMHQLVTSISKLTGKGGEVNAVAKFIELIGKNSVTSTTSSGALLTNLLKFGAVGVLIGGVAVAIGKLAIDTERASHQYENMSKVAKENIDTLNSEIDANKKKISSLSEIADEYDKLNGKVNKTSEEQNRLKDLTKEIAEIMPELVSGYDTEGNPILRMTDDAKSLITQLEKANQLKERMLVSEKKDAAMGAMGMMNTDSNNNLEQIAKRELEFNQKMSELESERRDVMNRLSKATSMDDRRKVLNDLENVNSKIESTENDFNMFLSDQAGTISSYNAQVSDALLSTVQSKDEFVSASEETKNAMLELIPTLDFSEIRPDELNQVTRAMDELVKLSNNGTIDLGNIKESVLNLNNELDNGQISMSDYNKQMGDLANYLSDLTGVDANVFTRMFDDIAFGSTNAKEGLSELEKEISSTITQLASTRDLEIRFDGLVELGNRDDIPQQLSDIIDAVTQDGMVTDKDMDLVFKALFEPESEEVQAAINEFNNTEVNIDTTIMGEEKVESFRQKLENVKSIDPKVKLELIKAYSEGDITFLEEHLRGLPEEERVKIIADVQEAINGLDEVDRKKIEEKTATVNTEVKEPESKGGILDFIFGKSKKSETTVNAVVNTQVNGLPELQEVERILNGIGGGKVGQSGYGIQRSLNESHDISLMNDGIESINDKVRASAGGSSGGIGGGYQVVVNVAVNGIDQIESLKNNLSTIQAANIIVNTAGAAKNISGLIAKINEYKGVVASTKSSNINVNTAQSAKNLSGLTNRVNQYKKAADGAKTATFKTETAQAAKNISGLIAKVGEWNRTNAKTLTFKTNANTVASQVQNLINKVKAVPNGKTINYSIKTTGSVPKIPNTFSSYQQGLDSTFNKIALLSDTTLPTPVANTDIQTFANSNILSNPNNFGKSSFLNNLELSRDVLKDISNIMNNIDVKKLDSLANISMPNIKSNANSVSTNNSTVINFNQPLMVIEGNATKDTLPDLRRAMEDLKRNIIDEINNGNVRTKRLEGRR